MLFPVFECGSVPQSMVHERKKNKRITQKQSSWLFNNMHEVNDFLTFDNLVSLFQALGQWGQ